MTVFDRGLQPERTALAWRRTALALLGASLVALRVLPHMMGVWGLGVGAAGAVASGVLLWLIHRRYIHHHQVLIQDGDRSALAGGYLIAATTLLCLSAGGVALAVTIMKAVAGGA